MVVELLPLDESELGPFVDRLAREYADEKVEAGAWAIEESRARAQSEIGKLLPDGLATRGHHLYSIYDPQRGLKVGALWLAIHADAPVPTGFIYDLFIDAPMRRQGYGTGAMLALERKARDLGLQVIALHVFGHNAAARELYTRVGYVITDFNMAKHLT